MPFDRHSPLRSPQRPLLRYSLYRRPHRRPAPAFGERVASVTFGPYARIEYGSSAPSLDGAYWLPPGESDPQIGFSATPLDDRAGFGSVAFGYHWQNGFRAELALFGTGTTGFTGPCSSVSNGTDCGEHSDITSASVSTSGFLGNVYYAPFEAQGSNSVFQPFIVAGIGVAQNEVGDWTRTKNPGNPTFGDNTVRSYSGATTSDVAWSVGFGAAFQVTRPGEWPVIVEAAWRYYDFGTASGGTEPLESGRPPREPLTFDLDTQVISIGVRIPLQRY
jgi:hypothetical protein